MTGRLLAHAMAPFRSFSRYLLEPVDAHVYAATRIALAALYFGIVLDQWPLRVHLYAAGGMVAERTDLFLYWPLAHVHSAAGISVLWALAGAFAVSLALGLCTRLSLLYLYTWLCGASVVALPAEAGYDAIARIAGFVLLFSPPIRALALDKALFGSGPLTLPRYGLRMLQWQLLVIYVATVWHKAPDPYWRNGELVSYFMLSIFSRTPSPIWAELGRTSVLLTWSALLMEIAVPLLLLTRHRRFGFLLGLLLHGGIAMVSSVSMFSLAMLPLYASFLTADDLRALRLLPAAPHGRPHPTPDAGAVPAIDETTP
jgi:hypothetical protein